MIDYSSSVHPDSVEDTHRERVLSPFCAQPPAEGFTRSSQGILTPALWWCVMCGGNVKAEEETQAEL